MYLWFETSLETSFPSEEQEDNSAIATWYDINTQSTIKKNATQSEASDKPIFIANAFNDAIPGIRFDGTDDLMPFDGSGLIASDYSIFIVEQRRDNDSVNYVISGIGNWKCFSS